MSLKNLLFETSLAQRLLGSDDNPSTLGDIIAQETHSFLEPNYVIVNVLGEEMACIGNTDVQSSQLTIPLESNNEKYVEIVIGGEVDCAKLAYFQGTVAKIISDRMRLYSKHLKLERLSTVDYLTGLSNKRAVNSFLEVLHSHNTPYSIFFFDIDFFKKLNGLYSETRADQILVQMAHLMTDSFRPSDLKARLGGDEFCIVCDRSNLENLSETHIPKFLKLVRQKIFTIDGSSDKINLTISIGGADYIPSRDYNLSYNDIIQRANDAEKKAKGEGKNRFTAFGVEQ